VGCDISHSRLYVVVVVSFPCSPASSLGDDFLLCMLLIFRRGTYCISTRYATPDRSLLSFHRRPPP
jgi:hypothetical protein